MVALRYTIQIRENAFAHRVTNPNGSLSVANISVMRLKVQQSCYATALRFNELEFGNRNPYAEGESQEDWDPMTGMKRARKQPTQANGKATAAADAPSTSKEKSPAQTAPKTSNYKGANFDPSYSNQ